MDRKNRPLVIGAVVAALGLTIGGLSLANAAEPASTSNLCSTQADALACIDGLRDYVSAHPDATVTPTATATTTTVAPTTASPTATADTTLPSNFKATAGDQKIVLTWAKPTGGTPTGYIYGRNGVDSTGYGAYTSEVLAASTTTVTLDKLVNGSAYTVFVQAVYASGNKQVSATATPKAPVVTTTTTTASPVPTTTTPAPTTTTVPPTLTPTTTPGTQPASGLTWSSGVWTDQDPASTNAFVAGPRGGRNVDNVLVYTYRQTQATQNNPTAWKASLPATFNGVSQDFVLALTTWTTDGAYMTAAQAQTIATAVCSVDSVHPIVRLDWEMNLSDGAGGNGAMLTAANYSAWTARFRTVAAALHAAPCGIQVDFNPNYGQDQTAGCNSGTYAWPNNCTRRAFQSLKDVVDIFGIDTYDSYPAVKADNSGWNARLTGNNALAEAKTYAVANGKKFSVPEWGVACNGSGCQWAGNAGGDDPQYIKQMVAFFAANANDMAYETYFNEPASYIVSDMISANPNSRAQYKASLLAQP